ncbi:MAG: DNA internalization-related competence protein ComEC/Rec2 [Desulfovermiculus sp.]
MDDFKSIPQARPKGVFVDLLPWQWFLLFALTGVYAFEYSAAGTLACVLLASLMRLSQKHALGLYWVPVAFAFGLIWTGLHGPPSMLPMPEWMEGRQKVEVQAQVHALRFKPENRIQVLLSDVTCLGNGFEQDLSGMVVWTWQDPEILPAPGQKVRTQMRIKPVHGFSNFHTWDTRAHWARQGVLYRSFSKGIKEPVHLEGEPGRLWSWRQKLRSNVIQATSPGPGQGLLLALLMGDRSQLNYETLDLVRRASLAHSLALSGLHLGFVIFLGLAAAWILGWAWPKLFLRFPRPMIALALGLPLVITYLWLGQGRASLLRAALMFFFWALLLLTGRKKALLDGLFFALLVFILWDPLVAFSLGWQLSMVAVSGILLLWPLIGLRFQNQRSVSGKVLFFFAAFFLLSVVANTALLPLLMANFGQLSPHLYLNMLWLPVLGFCVLPLGLAGMVFSLGSGGKALGTGCLHLSATILDVLTQFLEWLHNQGWLEVVITPRPGWPECLGYWLILGSLVLGLKTRSNKSLLVAGLGGVMLLAPWAFANAPWQGDTLEVRILDVGQGQAVYLEGPEGRRTLIDGGGSWNPDFDIGRFAVSPALTYRSLPRVETVVLSHSDFDHLRGLFFILRYYDVKRFIFNGEWPKGQDGRKLQQILEQQKIQVQAVQCGDRLEVGSDLFLDVLHPDPGFETEKSNDMSLVLKLCSQGHGLVLIPGDLETRGLAALKACEHNLQADLLVVPHHGSRGSLSPELYARVDPELAVVSCGFLNIFHFPHSEVQEALIQARVPIYCTSRNGEIQITWDMDSMSIKLVRTRLMNDN